MRTDLERKLYQACLHAYQWHCGTSSEQAEKDCMAVLMEAIEAYNEEGKVDKNCCEHVKIGDWFGIKKYVLYYSDGSYRAIPKEELFCSICGAKRPVEKELWEKMQDAVGMIDKHAITLADVARDHFKNGGV